MPATPSILPAPATALVPSPATAPVPVAPTPVSPPVSFPPVQEGFHMPTRRQLLTFKSRIHTGGPEMSDYELGAAYYSYRTGVILIARINALSALHGLAPLPTPTLEEVVADIKAFAAALEQDP